MSRPSAHKIGYTARRVGKQIMRHSVHTAELLHEIIDDLTDGDSDSLRALKAANTLGLKNIHLFDVGAGLADADMHETEAAGKRMVGETEKTA